jgi:site-specific DNA-methyltransferase (adenine-specific)
MSSLLDTMKTETAKAFNSTLTLDNLPDLWHEAPPRWGHPLHSVCSYFAMFPPQLARVIIEWLSFPGDPVYDPFSGRGTVALESVLLGRTAYASDANPLAQVLSRAKTSHR